MAILTFDSYSEANQNSDSWVTGDWNANDSAFGQSFTTPNDGITHKLASAKFYLKTVAAAYNLTAHVYAYSNYRPTGDPLATSAAITTGLAAGYALITFTFSGANQIDLAPNTNYVLVLRRNSGDEDMIVMGRDDSAPTHSGYFSWWSAGAWSATASYDFCFYVYGVEQKTLTITTVSNVTTSPTEGTHDYDINNAVPVTATPATGYLLLYWTRDGLNYGYLNPVTVTMDTVHTLTAVMLKYNSKKIDAIIGAFERA